VSEVKVPDCVYQSIVIHRRTIEACGGDVEHVHAPFDQLYRHPSFVVRVQAAFHQVVR